MSKILAREEMLQSLEIKTSPLFNTVSTLEAQLKGINPPGRAIPFYAGDLPAGRGNRKAPGMRPRRTKRASGFARASEGCGGIGGSATGGPHGPPHIIAAGGSVPALY